MRGKQLSLDTNKYFTNDKNYGYSSIIKKENEYYLKALIFRQSSRIVYRCVVSFWDVKELCKHTPVKPDDDKKILLNIDNIKNRYLEIKHGEEIRTYIKNNMEDFILPNLTSVINTPFHIALSLDSPKDISTGIFHELNKNNGSVLGYIKFDNETTFNICDGNHRTFSIHELVRNGYINNDIEGLYIGIDFYLEIDKEKEKQLFVNLNTNKSIDSSIMSLLKQRDALSNAAKSLLGFIDNFNYAVPSFYPESENYIGVDLLNNNVSKTSNTLSFNVIKNIISNFAFDNLNCTGKFECMYPDNSISYKKFMKKISRFLNYIFEKCEPFNKIKNDGSNVKTLRQDYISMTAAGLYIIAKIGHVAIENDNLDIISLAEHICNLDWKKEKNGKMNELFLDGILTKNGKILSNNSAINKSSYKLKILLQLTDVNIKINIDKK